MYPVGFSEEDNDAKDLMVGGGGEGGGRKGSEGRREGGGRQSGREVEFHFFH